MIVTHLKKKDILKSSVKGVVIEFDHDKLASILGVPGNNGIFEYIKDVWEESKYTKPLEITRRFANDETLMAARRVKGEEPKRYDYFEETFLTMCKLIRENGVWWIGSGENRRRDDDNVPEEEAQEEEGNQAEVDWEAVIDEAAEQGESGSDDQFFDAQVDVEEPVTETPAAPEVVAQDSVQQKETEASGVDPLGGPSGHIPESVMNKL
ncbi:hypothetical protein Dimus_003931 [Dionaea muscipula]